MKQILIILMLVSCLGLIAQDKESTKVPKKISKIVTIRKDDEANIKLQAGEVCAIRLLARLGTGLSWRLVSKDDSIQQPYVSKLSRVKLNRKDGKKDTVQLYREYQVFFLKPTMTGISNAIFVYKRHWDETDKPSKTVLIHFDIPDETEKKETKNSEIHETEAIRQAPESTKLEKPKDLK
ncbi:MAG: protease inhibitor I42 family protein [Leptospiraceae bacterium]|nr:protease inhibitor I42 family protein [Leptospiraceae bacterium]